MQTPFSSLTTMNDHLKTSPPILTLAAIAAMCLLTVLAYLPGMAGDFHLDDYPSLNKLDGYLASPSFESAWAFVVGNHTGPLGRPIAMASFLIDAFSWPLDAGPFRITNIALHLCNGLLLYVLVGRISAIAHSDSRSAAFWISAVWLLNPSHTATVLYVVQRMAILSTFFMLIGLILYVAGRQRYHENGRAGATLMVAGLLTGAFIGSLAKENAAAFPLLILAFEFTIFGAGTASTFIRAWRFAMVIPYAILLATHLIPWSKYVASFAWRPFTWWERILTQPVVIASYVRNTIAPTPQKIGIFNDQFPVVHNFITSPEAFLSLTALGLTLTAAICLRKKVPLAALCVLSFFACHALESSIFPLEIYFEHRNYLASGAVIALGYLLLRQGLPSLRPVARVAFGSVALAASAIVTNAIAIPWGDPTLGAIVWTTHFPESVRVRQMAADTWGRQGQFIQAERELNGGIERNPNFLVLRLQAVQMRCLSGENVATQMNEIRLSAPSATIDRSALDTLTHLQELAKSGKCAGLTTEAINEISTQLALNPFIEKADFLASYTWFIIAETSSDLGKLDAALEALDKVAQYRSETRTTFWKAVWSINNGQSERARELLNNARSHLPAANPGTDDVSRELAVTERVIRAHEETPPQFRIVVDPVALENASSNVKIEPRDENQSRIIVTR